MREILNKAAEVEALFKNGDYVGAFKAVGELASLTATFWQREFSGLLTAHNAPTAEEWQELNRCCEMLSACCDEHKRQMPEPVTMAGPTAISPDQVISIIQMVVSILDMIRKRRQQNQPT